MSGSVVPQTRADAQPVVQRLRTAAVLASAVIVARCSGWSSPSAWPCASASPWSPVCQAGDDLAPVPADPCVQVIHPPRSAPCRGVPPTVHCPLRLVSRVTSPRPSSKPRHIAIGTSACGPSNRIGPRITR
jgi:hypothetical protein